MVVVMLGATHSSQILSVALYLMKYSLLPSTAPDGYVVKVKSDPDSSTGDYFIRYNATMRISVW